jgi:hypothetical protein
MLFHWNVKRVETVRGSVADFCPVCRAPRAFQYFVVERVMEVIYLPLSRTPLGEFVRCGTCGATLASDAARFEAFADVGSDDLETLIATTRPDLRAEHAERLELEEALRRSPDALDVAQRARLLFEPFEALEAMVRNRLKEGMHFDAYSGLGCGGVVLALFFGPWITRNLAPSWHWLVGVLFGVAAVLGLWAIVQFFMNPGRSARKLVVPLLARSLAPLRPLQDEVALCLEQCRKERWKIGSHVRVDVLWQEMQKRELTTRPGT